jgi:excisionase family DNA binding protein
MSLSHDSDTRSVLLTPEQVRERLGISLRTYQRHLASGRLRASSRTPGGHRRFVQADVDAALQDTAEANA